jgi:hypothetical protein
MKQISLQNHVGVSGQYMCIVKHDDGTTTETNWFDNMILNSGLDAMGQEVDFVRICFLGTGTTAVAATQSSLSSRLDIPEPLRNAPVFANSGAPNYESTFTISFKYPQGAVIGNITEVGIGHSTDGTGLFSRSLITNTSGQPTAITVVAQDEFTLVYKLKIKPPTADVTGSFSLSGQTINYTAQAGNTVDFANPIHSLAPSFSNIYNGYLWSPVDLAMGSRESYTFESGGSHVAEHPEADIATSSLYVPGSYSRNAVIGWSYTNGNNGTVGAGGAIIMFGNPSAPLYFKYIFSTPIVKLNTQELRLNMTISWGRG